MAVCVVEFVLFKDGVVEAVVGVHLEPDIEEVGYDQEDGRDSGDIDN